MIGKIMSSAVRATADAVRNAATNAQISQAQADKQKANAAAVGKAAQNVAKRAMGVGAGITKAAGMKKGGSVTTRGQGAVMKKRPTKKC